MSQTTVKAVSSAREGSFLSHSEQSTSRMRIVKSAVAILEAPIEALLESAASLRVPHPRRPLEHCWRAGLRSEKV